MYAMSKQPTLATNAQWAVESLLEDLAGKFPPTSRMGRQLYAERATLKRKGLGGFLLETQELLEFWSGEAQTLQECKDVALQRLIQARACAALGVRGVGELTFVVGVASELGVCELCEGDLDALQCCFGCHKRLCTSCNKSRVCYPMCLECVHIWIPRRVHALFAAYLSLPVGERTDEKWRLLQLQLVQSR
jgi:hypothetical protein